MNQRISSDWQYTDNEIRSIYRQSKNKKNQVKILAELNCCSVEEIKKIIGIQEDCSMKDKSYTDDKKNELILKGLTTVKGMTFHDIEGGFGAGKKSMLVKDIAEIHGRESKHINEAINSNRKRFSSSIDIVDVKGTKFAVDLVDHKILTQNSVNAAKNIYLLSERGYSKLLKILEDDVAWEKYELLVDGYFNMRAGQKEQDIFSSMSKELRAIIMQDQKIQQVESRMDKLEKIMTIDYGQQEVLRNTVNITATTLLGGKESAAYKQMNKKVFSAIWNTYKERFNVSSYKDTPVTKFEAARQYLANWTPDYNLQLEIQEANTMAAS